jgi:geranylgeranyl reductase family protein
MGRVLVVGGGPAGSACAIEAAKNGLEVVLFEAGSSDRDKICGDGILPDSQRVLAHFGLLEKVQNSGTYMDKLTLYALRGEQIDFKMPVITLRRSVFDRILRDAAVDAGAKLYQDTSIVKTERTTDGVTAIDSKGNHYKGDVLALATGAKTSLAKEAGFEFGNAQAVAVRGYVRNVRGFEHCLLWFTKDIRPAYAWAAPSPNGLMNVGLGYYFDGQQCNAQNLLMKFVQTIGKDAIGTDEFVEKPKGWPLRSGLRSDAYGDRTLLLGENAECVFEFTGEGIGKAMQSGIAAANAISVAEQPYDKEQLATYGRELEKLRPIFDGYSRTKALFGNPISNYAFTKLLQNSSRARDALSDVLCENISPKELFSVKGLVKYW